MAVELTYIQNAMWRICGYSENFIDGTITKASNLDLNYRAQATIAVMRDYLKVTLGQPTKIGLVFPDEVYDLFLSKFDGDSFHYQDIEVDLDHLPPQNVSTSGDEISCDEHATKEVFCFKWNTVDKIFEDTEETGSVAGGAVTFSVLSNGNYVLGYSGDDFCTLVQNIST